MLPETDPQRIVRLLAFALRHPPYRFGVALDDEGFADLDDLAVGIRFSSYDWALFQRGHIEDTVRGTDPGRFEIRDNRIRARYGHSFRLGTAGEASVPPEILFHGTSTDSLADVLKTGLRAMNRAFVHLTTNPDYAARVASAKGGGTVLHIRAKEAADAGIEFFQANPHVWLAREVPPSLLLIEIERSVAERPLLENTACEAEG
jgi:putative RNA 2'-phosphotransferase